VRLGGKFLDLKTSLDQKLLKSRSGLGQPVRKTSFLGKNITQFIKEPGRVEA
jgi:hypothetical protein